MRNLSVLEGGRGRFQNGVRRVIADLQGGGTSAWVPSEERLLKTKYITENGTYLASAEELWGFSKLTVNVAGGAEGTQVPTVDKDGNPTDYQVPTYGPVTVDPNIDPSDYPTLPPISGGIGSQISGIDPISGNPVIATVEPNGEISLEPLPAKLHIGRLPDKLTYADGETIDIGGIQCFLLNEDNTVYDYGKYSKEVAHRAGLVPTVEITFEPSIADKSSSEAFLYRDGDGVVAAVFSTSYGETINEVGLTMSYTRGDKYNGDYNMSQHQVIEKGAWIASQDGPSTFLMTRYNNQYYYKLISGSSYLCAGCWQYGGFSSGGSGSSWYTSSTSYRVSSEQFSNGGATGIGTTNWGPITLIDVPESTKDPTEAGEMIPDEGNQTVTVKWRRQDGVYLTDTFKIMVTTAGGGGGGFSGGGGGGQGGDGGGGAF